MMNLKWMRKTSPIGLDIGSRRIKAVQLLREPTGWTPCAIANFPRLNSDEKPSSAEVRRIVEVLGRRSFKGNEIVLATPLDKQIITTMELPPVSAGVSLDPITRAEFCRSQKCDPGTFELAYWKLPAAMRAARNTDVMAVGCLHADSEVLIQLMAEHELEVIGLDVHSAALARGIAGQLQATDDIVTVVELGWSCVSLVILYRGIVIYERVISDGGLKSLYQSIESSMKIDTGMVDCVLENSGLLHDFVDPTKAVTEVGNDSAETIPSAFRHDVRMALTSYLQGIYEEIQESVSYTVHRYPDATVSRMVVTGGGAMIPGIEAFLAEMTGLTVQVGRPAGMDAVGGFLAGECNSSLMLATGLARYEQVNLVAASN